MEKLSSAAAFVEGGVQDACDDACSICLEVFCDSDPSTVTSCKHDFHLQCLAFLIRNSYCLVCNAFLQVPEKLPVSHVLAGNQHEGPSEAVEHERNMQADRSRAMAIFRHPMLGDFEVPVGADDAELEERIMHQLAAAAVSRRLHRHGRREVRRGRSGAHGHPQIVVSSATEATYNDSTPSGSRRDGDTEHSLATISARPLAPVDATEEASANLSARDDTFANSHVRSDSRTSGNQCIPVNKDEAQPSDLQSFSDTLKTRLQSVSTTYKDLITKNTHGWKERWFAQSNTISNLGSDLRREVNAGMAAVSRMMVRLETKDGTGPSSTSSGNTADASDTNNHRAAAPSNSGSAPMSNAASLGSCVSRSGSL